MKVQNVFESGKKYDVLLVKLVNGDVSTKEYRAIYLSEDDNFMIFDFGGNLGVEIVNKRILISASPITDYDNNTEVSN